MKINILDNKQVIKKEIHYLLSKVIEKYESVTGKIINRNSNRKNYEPIAILLSDISNNLPFSAEQYGHIEYPKDGNPNIRDYPFRKYDITGNQIKDAFFNQIISHPRPFLIDACYIYLYNMGKQRFLNNPIDLNLVDILNGLTENSTFDSSIWKKKLSRMRSSTKWLSVSTFILFLSTSLFSYLWYNQKQLWNTVISDLSILPYQPSKQEIKKMEGIWLCYTGSPQARPSDPDRFHKVVPNVIEVKYKNGYFVYNRYGASFNHAGYLQFEAPNLVSIHTFVKNEDGKIESPRHSLLSINNNDSIYNAISASWNFDIGDKNKIIGIREVYIKQGIGGKLSEVINTLENANCRCKIVQWTKLNKEIQKFYLKNVLLDSLKNPNLLSLINEKSILTRNPEDSILVPSKN